MTLVIELPPEVARQLLDAAARSGRDPAELARVAVAEKLAALEANETARRQRQIALLERWDAEDARRTDDMPAPEIPRLSLRTTGVD